MGAHDPFDGDTFVGASICGLTCLYEIVRPLMSSRHDGWQVRVTHRGLRSWPIGQTRMTWMQAMRYVAERVEAEVAPEEGREPEAL